MNTAGLIAVHAEDETRMIERKKMIEGRTDMAAHAEWRDDETALMQQSVLLPMPKQRAIAFTYSSHIGNRSRLVEWNHFNAWKTR